MSKKEKSAIVKENIQKIKVLRDKGINPYPYSYKITHSLVDIITQADKYINEKTEISIASRVMSLRTAGKNMVFLDLSATIQQLKVGTKIQLMIKKNKVDEETWTIVKYLSIGDWIGTFGVCFYTKVGELTVRVNKITMLSKIMKPLPVPKIYTDNDVNLKEIFSVQDQELLWRQPELDMLLKEKASTLVNRSKILQKIRNIMTGEYECIEIETPYLNAFFGGADATPFTTYVKSLSQELYLPVSPEIELKRTIVGGIGSGGALGKGAFYIARNFRNEGIDKTHNPEFTALEVYIPFVDYHYMMEVTEQLFRDACIAIHNKPVCEFQGAEIDFSKKWPVYEMTKLLSEKSGLSVEIMDLFELRKSLKQRNLHITHDFKFYKNNVSTIDKEKIIKIITDAQLDNFYSNLNDTDQEELVGIVHKHKLHNSIDLKQDWDYLILDLFDIYCEPFLIQPCHIIKHPEKSTPLCKIYRGDPLPNGQRLIERFESFAAGMELSNAYSELNDPIKQRDLVEQQAKKRESGDDEAMPYNELFLQSIEMGMPPCGGLGIGIDRMVMLLTNNPVIRNVIAFPTIKKTSI